MVLNYSVYALPAYYVLSLFPHSYALSIMKKANNGYWDNKNPRGLDTAAMYKKSITAETWARFERAEAAHKNGMENLPLVAAAIILGNMAKLSPTTLNMSMGAYLGLRVMYTYSYINITQNKRAFARTGVWVVSTLILIGTIIRAGNVLSK